MTRISTDFGHPLTPESKKLVDEVRAKLKEKIHPQVTIPTSSCIMLLFVLVMFCLLLMSLVDLTVPIIVRPL